MYNYYTLLKMYQTNGILYPKKEKPLKGLALHTKLEFLQPTEFIRKVFKKGEVKDEDGKNVKLIDQIKPQEGYFLYQVIKKNKFKNILEIGMENGISSLYICSALKESDNSNECKLTSIDPLQTIVWENTGIQTLRDAGLTKYHKLITEEGYFSLPKLVKEDKKYDLIFINGNQLFDYIILNIFFANKLLKINGMMIINNFKHESVNKAYNFFKLNYQNYNEIKNGINSDTQAVFVKLSEYERIWFSYSDF